MQTANNMKLKKKTQFTIKYHKKSFYFDLKSYLFFFSGADDFRNLLLHIWCLSVKHRSMWVYGLHWIAETIAPYLLTSNK